MNDKSRESKHIIISNLTDNLEDAANDLQKLVNCVQGEPTVEEKGEKIKYDHGATSLSTFLDEHPKRIGELTGKITEATNQLKALLY